MLFMPEKLQREFTQTTCSAHSGLYWIDTVKTGLYQLYMIQLFRL